MPAPRTCQLFHFLQDSFGLIQNSQRHCQQLRILLALPFFPLRSGLPRGQSNGHHSLLHCAHAVANSLLQAARLLDLLHGARQHARTIPQQTAIGRIVNVGFDHGRVHAQLSTLHYTVLPRHRHQSFVQIADHFRPDHLPNARQRLRIWHFPVANRKVQPGPRPWKIR